MQYTKAMVDLVKEARRRAPTEYKSSIKLADPDVFKILSGLYHKSKDSVFKAVIKELFALAGDPWPAKLEPKSDNSSHEETSRFITKIYRGQTILEKRPKTASDDAAKSNKPKRVYRGQVIG